MSLTKVSYSMIQGAVVNALDFGAVGDGTTDDTAAIQAAINYAGTLATNSVASVNPSFPSVEQAVVYLPAGRYSITGTLDLYPGVCLQGDGAQSTTLLHQGGNVSCIESGFYIAPGNFTNTSFSKWGGVKSLSIVGKKDPTYNNATVAGQIGKTHSTVYGIKLDGAYGSVLIEDVDIFYCQSGLWADRSYFMSAYRLRVFFSSNHGAQVYGSNLFKFVACDFQYNANAGFFLDRQDVGTGEITKASLFQSCDFESNLYQGAVLTNFNVLELDSCYFENNMLYNSVYPNTANQELLIDASSGFNRSLLVTNTIFNALIQTGASVDVIYAKVADKLTFNNNSLFNQNKQNSLVRFGDEVQTINWFSNNMVGNGVGIGDNSPVIYDKGCFAIANNMESTLPFKNMIANGQLQSWQRGTTATVTSGTQYLTADNWGVYEFDSGSISVSQQAFSGIQTDVPGYPNYYLRMQQTVASNAWGVTFKVLPTQFFSKSTSVSFGFWVRAASSQTISVLVSRFQSSGGNLNGTRVDYTIGTDWQFISYSEVLFQDLTQNPQDATNSLVFVIQCANGVDKVTNTFDFANAQAEVGNFPSSIAKINDSQNLIQCQEFFVQTATNAIVYSGQVSSGGTYLVSVRFPQPMRAAPTVTILSGSEINLAGAVTVSNITTTGFNVSVVADGTGYGEWIAGYRASAYY
jgi:hypothetical protein